jgi:hypothetical protein
MTDDRRRDQPDSDQPDSDQPMLLHCQEPNCTSTALIWSRRRRDEAPLPPWTIREGHTFCPEHSER